MKINEIRKIDSIELTEEEQDFLTELWKVAVDWVILNYNEFDEEDIKTVLSDMIHFTMNNDFNGTIKMNDIF